MKGKIELKTVNDLLEKNFFIPNYQRGYRWRKQQVTDLLNDIWSFAETYSKDAEKIYCVQPLVVSTKEDEILENCKTAKSVDEIKKILNGSWNVVDGQQRLTTIYLILKCLNEESLYSISYETRKDSCKFLKEINKNKENE